MCVRALEIFEKGPQSGHMMTLNNFLKSMSHAMHDAIFVALSTHLLFDSIQLVSEEVGD